MQEGLYQAGEQGLYQEQEGHYGGQEFPHQFQYEPDRSASLVEGEEASYGPDYPQGMAPLPGSLGLPGPHPGDPRAPRASFDEEEEAEPVPAGPRPGGGPTGLAQPNAGLFLYVFFSFMISYCFVLFFFSEFFPISS